MRKIFFPLVLLQLACFVACSQSKGKVKYYMIGHAIQGQGTCSPGKLIVNKEVEIDAGDYNIHFKQAKAIFDAQVSDPVFASRRFALVKTNQCLLVYSVTRKYKEFNNCETTTYYFITESSLENLKNAYAIRKVDQKGKPVCSECTYEELVWWPAK